MGAFSHPVLDGALVVTSPFGAREPGLRREPHTGVDLRAAIGSYVYAPGPGVVVQADPDEGRLTEDRGGVELRIALDNGYTVGFAHLLTVTVAVGTRVEPGDIVAGSGDTGTGTGPHLHVTLRDRNGVRVDPWPHMRSALATALRLGLVVGAGFLARFLLRRVWVRR